MRLRTIIFSCILINLFSGFFEKILIILLFCYKKYSLKMTFLSLKIITYLWIDKYFWKSWRQINIFLLFCTQIWKMMFCWKIYLFLNITQIIYFKVKFNFILRIYIRKGICVYKYTFQEKKRKTYLWKNIYNIKCLGPSLFSFIYMLINFLNENFVRDRAIGERSDGETTRVTKNVNI